MRAALMTLYVWRQYHLEFDNDTIYDICTSLCLPELDKDQFLSFWTNITQSFSEIKKVSMVIASL